MASDSTKQPCGLCSKRTLTQQKLLYCCVCAQWYHLKCTSLDTSDYHLISEQSNYIWYCRSCIESMLPFVAIEDELEFDNCIFNNSHGIKIDAQRLKNTNQLNLITSSLKIDRAFDPDRNYFQSTFKDSGYLTELQFNTSAHIKESDSFSVLHINARSVDKNLDKITLLLGGINHKFSVIALTETWSDKFKETIFDIDGYTKIMNHRDGGKRGGGVALLVDSDLSFSEIKELRYQNDDFESIFATVQLNDHTEIIVGSVYRPPGNDIKTFNYKFESALSKIKNGKKTCYIAGDFNINLLNHTSHTETGNFLNIMLGNKYYPLISRPTRFSKSGSTLIDNIFSNCMQESNVAGILVSDVSDHLPVFSILD